MPYVPKLYPEQLVPYSTEVQEAIALSLALFRRPDPWQPPKNTVIVEAMPLTFPDNGPGNMHFSEVPLGMPSFKDLMEDDLGDAFTELTDKPYGESLDWLFDDDAFRKEVFKNIPPEVLEYQYWILDELAFICFYRIAFGNRPSLLESMFEVFSSGGFPFGFQYNIRGEVELLAYYPASAGTEHAG